MDKLKDRYFIRYFTKDAEPVRMPLASRKTLFRVFVHFLAGNMKSLEVFREDYFNKKVFANERLNGVLVRGNGVSMRTKTIGTDIYDSYITRFSEGMFCPEKSGSYAFERVKIAPFTDEQFNNALEYLTLIQGK